MPESEHCWILSHEGEEVSRHDTYEEAINAGYERFGLSRFCVSEHPPRIQFSPVWGLSTEKAKFRRAVECAAGALWGGADHKCVAAEEEFWKLCDELGYDGVSTWTTQT